MTTFKHAKEVPRKSEAQQPQLIKHRPWIKYVLGFIVAAMIGVGYALVHLPKAASGMRVQGNLLLRDGSPYVSGGFSMIGVLSPPGCANRAGITARSHFGAAEMKAARSWGATMLRFQVSQSGLSTASTASLNTYLTEIESAVALARSYGFAVDLSMQDQSAGCGNSDPLPSTATVTAWRHLAPHFADDPYVMFELFNEPQNQPTPDGWAQWKNGGESPVPFAAVGHQALVEEIRGLGADNVLIADGASYAENLASVPALKDTSRGRGIVYAVHPYQFGGPDPLATWEQRYGYLTSSVPVIVTEWNYPADGCGTEEETEAPVFLRYLGSRHITVLAQAFDIIGTVVADWNWDPTQCGTAVGGAGQTIRAYLRSLPGSG